MTALYLASTSPARRKILSAIGLTAELLTPDVDEEQATKEMSGDKSAPGVALHLAKLKAESVLSPSVAGLVIGGDSVFEFQDELFGKPHEPEVARARWRAMRGQSGVLHSGLWVIDHTNGVHQGGRGVVASATLHFSATVTDDEIEAYVASGEPLKVAGAFTLDGLGAAFIDRVEGDPYAVVGMSASALRSLILELGHDYHALWNHQL